MTQPTKPTPKPPSSEIISGEESDARPQTMIVPARSALEAAGVPQGETSADLVLDTERVQKSGTHAANRDAPQTVFTTATQTGHRLSVKRFLVAWPGNDLGGAIPDFEIKGKLGSGGMGEVFLAKQTSVGRQVALKAMRPEANLPDFARKFLVEAAITGFLEHPNIVAVHELGQDQDGRLFYTMKRMTGVVWRTVIATRTLEQNLEILMQVADAAAFAHANGIIHRDIKPSNVLLGDYGEVILTDWGIAVAYDERGVGERLAANNASAGSPAYMSPEMARGDLGRVGPHSDVYLLGAVLYQILTGSPPHRGNDHDASYRQALLNEIGEIPGPPDLALIARRTLASRPDDRPETAKVFRDEIKAWLLHRQSLILADQGQQRLEDAIAKEDYQRHMEAAHAFASALTIWPENFRAQSGLKRARRLLAELAFRRQDLDLAESQLDAQDPEDAALRTRIQTRRQERNSLAERLEAKSRMAELEAARNRAAVGFLLEVISRAAPDRTGPGTTVLQAVSDVSHTIDLRFAHDPQHLAALHTTLGAIWRDVQHLADASHHLERAGQVLATHCGIESLEALAWRSERAQFLLASGQTQSAEAEFRAVLGLAGKLAGPDAPDALAAENNLASATLAAGNPEEALARIEGLVEHASRSLGAQHPTTIAAEMNLLLTRRRVGLLELAAREGRVLQQKLFATLGGDHPHTTTVQAELAHIAWAQGQAQQALSLWKQVLLARTRHHGLRALPTLFTLLTIAKIELALADPQAGVSARTILENLADDAPATLRNASKAVLAEALIAVDKPDEAFEILGQNDEGFDEAALSCRLARAGALISLGRQEEARGSLLPVLEYLKVHPSPAHLALAQERLDQATQG